MISSFSPSLERGLDTVLLVYYLLQGHPASLVCEQFLRSHSGWFTSPLVLIEVKNQLTKTYGVVASAATAKLLQFTSSPVTLLDLNPMVFTSAISLADAHGLDLTDAVLLHQALQHGVRELATEDQRLAQVAVQFGITPLSPLDATLRQQIASWELAHVPAKGLPRILRRVHQWLSQGHSQAAQDLWSATGGGNHLP